MQVVFLDPMDHGLEYDEHEEQGHLTVFSPSESQDCCSQATFDRMKNVHRTSTEDDISSVYLREMMEMLMERLEKVQVQGRERRKKDHWIEESCQKPNNENAADNANMEIGRCSDGRGQMICTAIKL